MKSFQMLIACAVLIVSSQLAGADQIVAPSGQVLTEGTSANVHPFGMDSTDPLNNSPLVSQRYQRARSASAFSGLGGPVTIEGISFRPNAEYGSDFPTTLSDIQISPSTTSRALDELTAVFADNVGSDETIIVGRGSLALSSAFSGPIDAPKDIDIYIGLHTAFVYDPGVRNLLLDVSNYAGRADSSVLPVFDAEVSNDLWRAYTTDRDVDGGPPAVPVPGAFVLPTLGLPGLARHRRRWLR